MAVTLNNEFFQQVLIVAAVIIIGQIIYRNTRQWLFKSGSGETEAKSAIRAILQEHFAFYNDLSDEGKEKFISRVRAFIAGKKFVGLEGLQVTFEMKVRIAATAVKLTFGLDRTGFGHYKVIRIFPESFYSRMHDRYLKGGASTGGTLFFSWKDFNEGYADPNDRYNLGLHEMAHALRIELKYGSDFDSRFADYSDHWVQLALPEFEKMNLGKTSFLREYGGTNIEEFFAVCVEHFFEVPEEFRLHLPDIFNHLCFLLNLDPTRSNDDYRLEPGFIEKVNSDPARLPLPRKVRKAYQYYDWHWSFNFIISGLIGGSAVIIYLYGKVLFTGMQVVLFFLTVVSLLILLRQLLLRYGIFYFRHLMLFGFAGVAPLLGALFLIINYNWASGVHTTAHKVVAFNYYIRNVDGKRVGFCEYRLEGDAYDRYKSARTFSTETFDPYAPQGTIYVWVTTSKGIMGLDNLENKGLMFFP